MDSGVLPQNDVILSPFPVPEKKSKLKKIIILVLIFVLVGAGVAGVLIYKNEHDKKVAEAKGALLELRDSYKAFIDVYDDIGYQPSKNLDFVDWPGYFPFYGYTIDGSEAAIDKVNQAIEAVDSSNLSMIMDGGQIGSYEEAKIKIYNTIDTASRNVGVLRKFYDLFATGLYRLKSGEDDPTKDCGIVAADYSGYFVNQKVISAADKYLDAYCHVNYVLYSGGGFGDIDDSRIVDAKRALINSLAVIDDDGYDQLDSIIEEVINAR